MWNESESRDVSNSRVSENQDPGEIHNQRDLLKYIFKTKKTEISFAIKETFPFLETLHDYELITDEVYEGLKNDFRKGVPVSKVVYNVLETLEEEFEELYLDILFSDVHLREYPDLQKIRNNFKEGIQQIMHIEENRGEGAQEIPPNPLRLDQGADENLPGSLTFMNQNATTPNGADFSDCGVQTNTYSLKPLEIKEEEPFNSKAECSQGLDIVEISSDEPIDISDEESQGASTSAPKRKIGPRIPKDIYMNFQLPELPVTCGQAKGTLYKEKMREGSSSLCILAEDQKTWLTLRQFEIKGGMEKSKNWRLSVRCGGWTLKELIKKNHLPNPPTTKTARTTQMSFQDASYDPCDSVPLGLLNRKTPAAEETEEIDLNIWE